MRNIIIEISPINKETGLTQTIRLASIKADASGTILDGRFWTPAISRAPQFRFTVWSDGKPQPLNSSYGSFTFSMNAKDFENLSWSTLHFKDAIAVVWFGRLGDDFSQYRKIYTGPCGPLHRNGSEATVELLGCEASLIRPLLSADYAGTGGAEGAADITGNLKPWSMGECINISSVLLSASHWIFQVDGYDACPIRAVYEIGIKIADAPKAIVSSYAELRDLTLKPGEYATAPSVGMFRLGGEPKSATNITADIGSPTSAGDIIAAMITAAGQGSKITPSISAATSVYHYHTQEATTILDAVREIALAAGKYLIADADGRWHLADHVSTKVPKFINSDRSSDLLIYPDTIVQEAVADPSWRVKIGHTRVYNAGGELSSALLDAGAVSAAIEAAAKAAQDDADAAQASADLANRRYLAMADDSVLDRPEKLGLIADVEGYTAERSGLIAEALSQGITTERVAYSNAYDAMMSYLRSLVPAWDNISIDTPVVRNDFVSAINGYTVSKQNLSNALFNKAKKTANWTLIPDRPTDLPGLDPVRGSKVDGIETGATVGGTTGPSGNIKNPDGSAFIPVGATDVAAAIKVETDRAKEDVRATRDEIARAKADLLADDTAIRSTIATVKQAADNARAAVGDEATIRANADGAISNRLSTVEANYVSSGTVNSIVTAKVSDEATARANADSAISNRVSTLEAGSSSGNSDVLAKINDEATVRANADSALANRATTLESNYTSVRRDLGQWNLDRYNEVVALQSSVSTEQTTRANADSALGSRIDSVSARAGSLESSVSTQSSAIATLNGKAGAFFRVDAVAAGNRAQLSVYADANGGAGVDIVGDTTFRGNLNVGPDSGQRVKITSQGFTIYDANNVQRVKIGLF